jgi:thioesterase domain-containing protein
MTEFTGNDAAEVVVTAHWTDLLGRPPTHADMDFFDAGGTQETARELVARIQGATSADIPPDIIAHARTCRKISGELRQTGLSMQRFIRLGNTTAGLPLVMLPSGACTVAGYHLLGGTALGRPVFGIQARGLNPEDGFPLDNLGALITDFADVLRDHLTGRRIHLGGFCWGGIFAYELARSLLDDGWEVLSVTLMNPQLEFNRTTAEDILLNRLGVLARMAGSDQSAAVDLAEDDPAVFGPRFHIFAMLWRALIGYAPKPLDAPVRLFFTPALKTADYWSTIGLTDLRIYHVPGTFEDVTRHVPSIERLRHLLDELEQSTRRPWCEDTSESRPRAAENT